MRLETCCQDRGNRLHCVCRGRVRTHSAGRLAPGGPADPRLEMSRKYSRWARGCCSGTMTTTCSYEMQRKAVTLLGAYRGELTRAFIRAAAVSSQMSAVAEALLFCKGLTAFGRSSGTDCRDRGDRSKHLMLHQCPSQGSQTKSDVSLAAPSQVLTPTLGGVGEMLVKGCSAGRKWKNQSTFIVRNSVGIV